MVEFQKSLLRNALRTRRRSMQPAHAAALSRIITDRVLTMVDWQTVNRLHTYTPLTRHREIDIFPLLKTLWQHYPHIQVVTWAKADNGVAFQSLHTDGHGEVSARDEQFDLILVPLLGFNEQCFRIGFGGGVYDSFLATQPHAHTIGLGYEFGRVAFDPDAHDIPLKHIVTEKAIYSPPPQSTNTAQGGGMPSA